MKLRKIKSCWCGILTLHEKRIFQHQYQEQVKMCIYLHLFHDWFPLEFVFIYSIYLMYKYLLELIKRRPNVQEKNMSCERALNFDQWKLFSKKYDPKRVYKWLVHKFTENNIACNFYPSLKVASYHPQKRYLTTLNERSIQLENNVISSQKIFCELNS